MDHPITKFDVWLMWFCTMSYVSEGSPAAWIYIGGAFLVTAISLLSPIRCERGGRE